MEYFLYFLMFCIALNTIKFIYEEITKEKE